MFHQGVAEWTDWSFGTVTIVVGAVVLLLWVPLRQRPGIGTVSNVVATWSRRRRMLCLPTPGPTAVRMAFLVTGVILNGMASGAYIGASWAPDLGTG